MFKKIYIEITNVCNLKCKFCPDTLRKKEFISVDNFEKVISKIYTYTNLVALHVKGEPLLHPELSKLLSILEKYKLKANITTNGTLIKETLEVIKKSKAVRQINFSIHSISQNGGDDEKYLTDIFDSVEQLEDIIVSYRLWNLKNIKENDFNYYIISKIEEHYEIENLKQQLTQNEFFKLRENVFINQDLEFTWPSKNGEKIIEAGRCLALKDQIAILVDGTIVPCCLDNDGDIPLGDILENSLEDVLNSTQSLTIKKNFENRIITCDICKTCGFLRRLEEKRKRGYN